jgi:hypothetical protein
MIIATHPQGSSNWLARDLLQRAERRFGLPLTHVVVDTTRFGDRPPDVAAAVQRTTIAGLPVVEAARFLAPPSHAPS